MNILDVKHLSKGYPSFLLDDISFSLPKGKITGFIGRNGAGKTTTLKSLINFIHPDQGEISFWGLPFNENEMEIKKRISFVSGGIDYYSTKKLKTITEVTKGFYPNWSDEAYQSYSRQFNLEQNKTPAQLSAGMKIKYALALALSHQAELLILDEPTSGLDPISRDEVLSIFMDLGEQGLTILFSSHIITDLEKCADHILYIQKGRLFANSTVEDFTNQYRLVQLDKGFKVDEAKAPLIGLKKSKTGFTALVAADKIGDFSFATHPADLETIMIHLEQEAAK